jgi:cell division protease FtsH
VIAKGLLEYETLDAKHIHEIMEHGGIQNPPSSPTPPDLPSDTPKKRPVEKEKESEGDFPGLPAPA